MKQSGGRRVLIFLCFATNVDCDHCSQDCSIFFQIALFSHTHLCFRIYTPPFAGRIALFCGALHICEAGVNRYMGFGAFRRQVMAAFLVGSAIGYNNTRQFSPYVRYPRLLAASVGTINGFFMAFIICGIRTTAKE